LRELTRAKAQWCVT